MNPIKDIWYLYRMRCLVEGVGDYIGITRRPFERERAHRLHKAGAKLRAAIELFGNENFVYEIIATFANEHDARKQERLAIRESRTYWPLGLNILGAGPGAYSALPSAEDIFYGVKSAIAAQSDLVRARSKMVRRRLPKGQHVYLITHVATGMKYVGRTGQGRKRFLQHMHTRCNSKIAEAMRVHGPDAFRFEVLKTYQSKAEAKAAERALIASMGTIWPNGFNLQSGGSGTLAANMSDEQRKMRSDRQRGRVRGDEHRAKIRESWVRTREQRMVSVIETNRRIAEEKKLSGSQKGKPSPFKGVKRGAYGQSRIKEGTNEKRSASLKAFYNTPDARNRASEINSQNWQQDGVKEKHAASLRRALAEPEVKKKLSDALRKRWADPAFRERMNQKKAMREKQKALLLTPPQGEA